ncbi:MAG: DNA polymerase III subunit alpha [Myxococcales bacterium]|nr:DNA polymerase III subunit alpha [Myxococcales bacterium]HIL81107.1 DNA polymerase III subunit alpha [Myxococcales bacterium]
MPAPFVHLHLHTQYSLLDGAIKHNPLFERAKSANMPAVAQTDHGNLFGTVEFYEKARANDIKPIIGCEVYFAGGSRFDREKKQRAETGYDAINHLLLLAMDARGYQNLMALVSKAYLEGFYYKPRIDWELLETYHQGLICTSGCLSAPVPRSILANEPDTAWTMAEDFKRLFGDRYYLEVQRHGIPAQEIVNQELLKMHHDMGIPLVATNDAHYLEEHDHDDHDVLLCVGTAANVSDEQRFRFDGHGFYVKDGDAMLEVFHDMPKAVEATLEIAERCDVEIPMGEYHMPDYQVPSGKSLDDVMEEQAWTGLRAKLGMDVGEPFVGDREAYKQRLEHELGVIKGMGFPGYFLIVADFINYAKANDIPVGPGRGSSAGSLVAFGMNITNVDPVEYDIIFERFLNPERISMPDIDVDFCMRGREQVIRYVADKYDGDVPEGDSLEGRYDKMKVAQIVTFGTLQAKAAIRDVGRVLGMSYGEVDRIAKMIPEVLGIKIEEAIAQSPELRTAMDSDGQIKRLLDTARNLEGITRHASKHAAGVVVGTRPLIEMVPLYKDPKSGDVMTQYNMNCVEQIGLIKFDFLGLKTLTLMADAERMIRRKPGLAEFDVNGIPMDDPTTYELLCRGDTEGVFQVESSGMTDLVLKLKPATFREIIPLVALYRPGPLQSGMVDDYVARKSGATKIEYLHPSIIDLTEETLGVIIYQDQVLQIAQKMAGYSLGEADLLRRAMGKKKADVMQQQRERFISGSITNDIDGKEAGRVFDLIVEFAGYGFPKAHSTAYAYITYQTAYLKANHPAEYLASVLTIESSNHDRLSRYIAHVREKGIEILPPDVNHSDLDFGVVDGAIRFGFAGIKNVGAGAIEVILEARREGAFESLFDFADRVDARKVNRRVVEALVKCGAFDSLHPGRASVWASIDGALERAASMQRDRAVGQESLFGGLGDGAGLDIPKLIEKTDWNDRERLSFEKELLGFYVTGHPLSSVAPLLASFTDTTSLTAAGKAGREIRAGGLLTGLRETRTKRGLRMGFGTLEDLEGSFELVIFTESFEQHVGLLREAKDEMTAAGERGPIPLIIHGTLEEGDPPKILVRDVTRLDIAEEKLAASLRVRVKSPDITRDRLIALKRLLSAHAGDCGVYLHITIPGESETVLGVGGIRGVSPTMELCQEVDRLFGRPVTERAI